MNKSAEPTAGGIAMVTPSYAGDFDRCRLLCDTIDRFVTGMDRHYILVEQRDVARFRQLETPRRIVVDERDILPSWLHAVSDPISRRRLWLGWGVKPLRGWHVQQLRRIAIARHAPEDVLVYTDSDVAFLKPFDLGAFRRDGKVRLFLRERGLLTRRDAGHADWNRHAAAILGLPKGSMTDHDYISTLISWRRKSIIAMCERMEEVTGRHWIKAIASSRKFSECMFYGRYVDEVAHGADHFHGSEEWCSVAWAGDRMDDAAFRRHVEAMTPDQVAICIQSFIRIDTADMRRLLGAG